MVSRTLAWLAILRATVRTRATEHASAGTWPVHLVLHSGPWLLVICAAGIRYVATSKPPESLWALVGGLAAAFAFLSFLRIRIPSKPTEALTPQRLAQIRQEFFLIYIALTTIVVTAFAGFSRWDTLDRDYPLVILCAVVSPLQGWLSALVMWQWKSALVQVAEKRRKQRAQLEAGTTGAAEAAASRPRAAARQ